MMLKIYVALNATNVFQGRNNKQEKFLLYDPGGCRESTVLYSELFVVRCACVLYA